MGAEQSFSWFRVGALRLEHSAKTTKDSDARNQSREKGKIWGLGNFTENEYF